MKFCKFIAIFVFSISVVDVAFGKDYLFTIFVDAPEINYENSQVIVDSMALRVSRGKNAFGHAWISLREHVNENLVSIMTVGFSGEVGVVAPKYFDGVMNLVQYGICNPTKMQRKRFHKERNPIKYLWKTFDDGFLQCDYTCCRYSYCASIYISEKQLDSMYSFMKKHHHRHMKYSLTKNQCVDFVTDIAYVVGWKLDNKITIDIMQDIVVDGCKIRLWENPKYSKITFSSPDMLLKNLQKSVDEGLAFIIDDDKKKFSR